MQERKTRCVMELVPKVLEERERYIIVSRYGLFGRKAMTQREIAKTLEISRSYVSRLEKRALQKLRQAYSEKNLFTG